MPTPIRRPSASAAGLPSIGALQVGAGVPFGAGLVDVLASLPEQRIFWILRHEQALAATLVSGTVDFFNVTTSAAQDGNVERANTIAEPQIYFVFAHAFRITRSVAATALTTADATLIAEALYQTEMINQRVEFGPVSVMHLPAGAGMAGASSTTVAATTIETVSNGVPAPSCLYWSPIPWVYKGGEFFRTIIAVEKTLASLAATRRGECSKHGILFRRAVAQ